MPPSTGYVYIFNASIQTVRLAVNNNGWSSPIQPVPRQGTSPTPYRPSETQLQRLSPPSTELGFVDGEQNSVVVQLRNGSQSNVAHVAIPATGTCTDDLWLYVTYELLLLLSTAGTITTRAKLTWP
jgi:hypothetical protein